ncbi:hypothetical protein ABI_15210 [Asticcacaulis biprosthecium C19]|uniref:Uncharacterized protein n=1 Tax=Asticcacaulis biprosthecium C19 TaxID=715226 RepID=F4QJ18_9CAUL|nr:hypothetical protein [Asticcacaulis biprosthecium]EGF93081.1 hypothetical protein ABI_15210 [Asticcacaulis biprosthecium C19]
MNAVIVSPVQAAVDLVRSGVFAGVAAVRCKVPPRLVFDACRDQRIVPAGHEFNPRFKGMS